ncbi:MAG: WecB/TagA/CpsF family glycosyltransferase [Planctomycetota bacterium]
MTTLRHEPPLPEPRLASPARIRLSSKRDLFGVDLDAVDPPRAMALITKWALEGRPSTVGFTAVHGLVTAVQNDAFCETLNGLDLLAPDGQPLRWALQRFYGEQLSERVYGPHTMWKLCAWAADSDVGVYLYGSTEPVIEKLSKRLHEAFPALDIRGAESPPFRPLTDDEDAAMVQRINDSGAKLVFIGLGCPKQEQFIYEHREQIRGVQLAVGAAFDFHAGTLPMAPPWMQRHGLEWLYRLYREPRRLWRRYVGTNSVFLWLCLKRIVFGTKPATTPQRRTD